MPDRISKPGLVILGDKPYHRQDERSFCGAACAQMMLDALEEGQELYEQDYLERLIVSNNTSDPTIPWVAGPDGLWWVLDRHQPAGDSPGQIPAYRDQFRRKSLAQNHMVHF